MKIILCLTSYFLSHIILIPVSGQDAITTGTLLHEMIDLERLGSFPEKPYKTLQFSSYDRRSIIPGSTGWFANSDGFGNEPIPGFDKVLKAPDGSGIGTYLICDVEGSGAILRLWSAGINGKIRFFLDDMDSPLYEGAAIDFFWNTVEKISDGKEEGGDFGSFRQFDATYFPIPFSKRCRIEWVGNTKEIHFYHVGIRLYDADTKVETFKADDLKKYAAKIKNVSDEMGKEDVEQSNGKLDPRLVDLELPGQSVKQLSKINGAGAIDLLSLKIIAKDLEKALRNSILSIYFDEASVPQVQSPVGDFFGSAPGLNPYRSLPFSVLDDGTMICRFIMPFKHSARIEIENPMKDPIHISAKIHTADYDWVDGSSMHFRARWKLNHGLTASNTSIVDIPYFITMGKGRIVGAAAYLYNPSDVVTSWGNWWGEGDEKIFIDKDTFPSFFGTGSEDYFNYSWSSNKIFAFPYCGQPRNDGPGNRGYVSNYRWHITDDLLFQERIAFYMELLHHGVVPNFTYGRIVYAYTLPGSIDDYMPILYRDTDMIPYLPWEPLAYKGSKGFIFVQAEDVLETQSSAIIERGNLWSENGILMWKTGKKNDIMSFTFNNHQGGEIKIGLTLAHMPDGGKISIYLNNELVKIGNSESIDLNDPYQTILRNHFSTTTLFKKGKNEITFKYLNELSGKKIGIDFFWFRSATSG